MSSFPTNNDLNPDGPPKPDESKIREEKAKVLIEEIIEEKLKPINIQLAEMPNLIKNTIYSVFTEMQQQQVQQQTQQQPIQKPTAAQSQPMNLDGIKAISEIVGPLFGKGGSGDGVDFKTLMADWGMKMFQYHLDNMAQSVYGIRLPPPPDVKNRTQPTQQTPKSNLTFE